VFLTAGDGLGSPIHYALIRSLWIKQALVLPLCRFARALAGTCYIAPRSSGTSPNLKHLGVAEISRRGIAVRVNEGADNSRYSFASSGGLPSAFGGDEPYRLHLYWNSIEHGEAMCLMIESAAMSQDLPLEFFARVIWQESRFNPTRRSDD
jgi:hypothetical protein